MVTALIGGSLVGGAVWAWAKLVAPWARAQGLHEELLEIQRELVVPAKGGESQYVEGLANLAAMTSLCSGDSTADCLDLHPNLEK